MNPELYPTFSASEYDRRFQAVYRLMDEQDVDALVVFGWSSSGRAGQADVHYLANYLGMRDNYVVVPRTGEPVFFVQNYNHVPNAAEVSNLTDVRWGGVAPGRVLGEELNLRGARSVGVVGMMPYQHHHDMRSTSDAARFVDLSFAYKRLRMDKSDEEIEWLRKGAAFTDAALEALAAELRPGLLEYQLGSIIESAYLDDGGLTQMYYLATTPMERPDRCVPAQVLSSRRIEAGDVVSCEISISYGGYAGQGLRTYSVAAEPTGLISELHDVAEQVYHSVRSAIRPGATHEDVWDASDLIEESGYTIRDALLHGFGMGILPPGVRTRSTTQIDEPWTFQENQTLVIQPNVITLDEKAGVQTGDLCVVTADGCESLHRFPLELIRAG